MPETHVIEVTSYTIDELKELGGRGYDKALEWLSEGATEYGWWQDEIENWILDQAQERWGITFDPKNVTFDLDRGSFFCFGKTSEVDDKVFLKAAGIDLRTKAAREITQDGGQLVLGVSYFGGGRQSNWIGLYQWECIPSYIEEMQPGITEKLEDTLRDAEEFALKVLRDTLEGLESEEYLVETAQINEYRFTEDGEVWLG